MQHFPAEKEIITKGYPSYTTSAGWIGYTELQLHELCQKYLKAGWTRLVHVGIIFSNYQAIECFQLQENMLTE